MAIVFASCMPDRGPPVGAPSFNLISIPVDCNIEAAYYVGGSPDSTVFIISGSAQGIDRLLTGLHFEPVAKESPFGKFFRDTIIPRFGREHSMSELQNMHFYQVSSREAKKLIYGMLEPNRNLLIILVEYL